MKTMKKIISVFLSLLIISTVAFSAAAEKKEKKNPDNETQTVEEAEKSKDTDSKKFTKEKAAAAALTAAKSRYASEGLDIDTISRAVVTKLKYSKKDSSFYVTVRAKRIYKYECQISVKNFLGAEIGLPEDSAYEKCGKLSSFFAQIFEKISYAFIRLFNMDEVKK